MPSLDERPRWAAKGYADARDRLEARLALLGVTLPKRPDPDAIAARRRRRKVAAAVAGALLDRPLAQYRQSRARRRHPRGRAQERGLADWSPTCLQWRCL